jgi:GDPmannose 4,6-dehydratase
MSFKEIGVELEFKGEAEDEVGVVVSSTNPDYAVEIGQEVVAVDPRYYRPTEVELLIGDSSKARKLLDWEPKYDVEALCAEMVRADVVLFQQNQVLKNAGFDIKNEFE